MRILQVSSASRFGGGETHVIELTAKLRALGHDVSVVGRASGPLHPDITLSLRNSADFVSALRLRAVLRERKVDVVHAHVARDYPIVAAAAWGLSGMRVICTRHLLRPLKRHALYRRVDGWIAPTQQIARTLDPLHPRRIAVIPNWVDLRKFSFGPHDLHAPVIIGLVGQISAHKGHDDAIAAMNDLGPEYRLLVAGKGDSNYVDSLKRKSTAANVEFVGFVSAPKFFQSIDVLVVPSWEEPFGIVLLEAMASGIPVVATDGGGPREIIISPEHGTLVPPRNSSALANAIRTICQSDQYRRSVVHAARKRVEEEYGIDNVVSRIEAFYRSEIGV